MPMDRDRRTRAERSLLDFMSEYLAHYMTEACGAFHIELCEEIDTALLPGQRLVGALPREHAKTTIGTTAVAIYCLCTRKKYFIRIWGANEEESKDKLSNIRMELESNPLLMADYGEDILPAKDSKGTKVKDNDTAIIFKNGVKIEARIFMVKGRGGLQHSGRTLKRPDLYILDDPEDDKEVDSLLWRNKAKLWYDRALLGGLDKKSGSLIHLGTILHFDSILSRLLTPKTGKLSGRQVVQGEKPLPKWRRLFKAAIILEPGQSLWEGRPLWPEKWTMEDLRVKYDELTPFGFMSEMMNEPIDPGSQIFHRDGFKRYRAEPTFEHGRWWLPAPPLPGRISETKLQPLETFEVADPAMEVGIDHDHSAYMIIGAMRLAGLERPLMFILHCERLKIGIGQQLAKITQLYRTWQPSRIGLSKVNVGNLLSVQAVEKALPITEVPEIDAKHTRITWAAGVVAQGLVYVPQEAPWLEEFFTEAENYNGAKKKPQDDQLDCLAHGIFLCSRNSGMLVYRSKRKLGRLRLANYN